MCKTFSRPISRVFIEPLLICTFQFAYVRRFGVFGQKSNLIFLRKRFPGSAVIKICKVKQVYLLTQFNENTLILLKKLEF